MPFRQKHSVPTNEQVLGAIESLKRVVGVPDHSVHSDTMNKYGLLTIHTPDQDSARILNGLFVYFVHGTKPAYEFDREGRRKSLNVPRFTIDKRESETDCEVTAYLTPAKRRVFVERLYSFIGAFIAPSNSGALQESDTPLPPTSPSR